LSKEAINLKRFRLKISPLFPDDMLFDLQTKIENQVEDEFENNKNPMKINEHSKIQR